MHDVIVIGSGLSGLVSAAAAVQEGKEVLVVSKGLGSIYSSSGFIDILGYYPPQRKTPRLNITEAIKEFLASNREHPYNIVGQEIIEEACNFFLKLTETIGYPYSGNGKENRLLPTAAGALAPTALLPLSAACQLSDYQRILVVGFQEYLDFYPAYTAENLKSEFKKHNLKIKVENIKLKLDLNQTRELNSYDLAVQMEKEHILTKVTKNLHKKVDGETLLALPAVLGVTKWQKVYNRLKEDLQCDILEIPTLPPSITGMRLAERIKDFLSGQGVEFILGHKVKGIIEKDICQGIVVELPGGREKVWKAKNYILATGGVLGGGIKVTPTSFKEEVFNIPVSFPQNNWTESNFFAPGGQPYSSSGIRVNENLNPLDKSGKIVFLNNVFCAGKNLAGYDPFVEKSGNGVALVTGYKAGLLASERGGRR